MDELAHKLEETTERSIRNDERITKLEDEHKALTELALSVQELATNQSNMKADLNEIKKDIKSITAIPAKRWDGLIEKAVGVLVAGFIAYILASGGL